MILQIANAEHNTHIVFNFQNSESSAILLGTSRPEIQNIVMCLSYTVISTSK